MLVKSIKNYKFGVTVFLINLFWLLALYPARLGADSSALLSMIRDGKSTDWWTGTFYWFFRLTSFGGKYPALTSAIQLLIFSSAIIYLIFSFRFSLRTQKLTTVIFLMSPIYGFFGMAIAHDLTQTAGVLLVVAFEFRILNSLEKSRDSLVLPIACALLLTTHSGVILIIIVLFRLLAFKGVKITILTSVILAMVYSLTSHGITKHLEVYGRQIPTSEIKFYPALGSLKCIAQHPEADISPSEWTVLKKISREENWLKPVSCSSFDTLKGALDLQNNKLNFNSFEFLKTYISVVAKNPAVAAMSHIQRARGVLPPLLFQPPTNQVNLDPNTPIGNGTNTALQSGPELLHPSNDLPGEEKGKPKIFNILEFPAQASAFLFNQASWFWGWGGMWLLIALLILITNMRNQRVYRILLCSYPILILHLFLLYFIPESMPRYYMYSSVFGIVISLGFGLTYTEKRHSNIE